MTLEEAAKILKEAAKIQREAEYKSIAAGLAQDAARRELRKANEDLAKLRYEVMSKLEEES